MSGYISVIFPSAISAEFRDPFTVASAFWNNVITGGGDGITFTSSFNAQSICGVSHTFAPGTKINGLGIFAEVVPIDGTGAILGQAGPCGFIDDFPVLGIMKFDSADSGQLVKEGQFEEVIIHEMGHVIGIGGMWQSLGFVRNPCTRAPCTHQPSYVGANGLQGFADLGGSGILAVSNENGPGTFNAHWDEDVFDFELMTGFLNADSPNPLSVLSIKSMRDLGYSVNLAAAEDYDIPSEFARPLGGRKLQLSGEMLHFDNVDLAQEIELQARALGRNNQPEDVSGSLTGILSVMIVGFMAMMGFMQYSATKQRKALEMMAHGQQIATRAAPSKKVIEP